MRDDNDNDNDAAFTFEFDGWAMWVLLAIALIPWTTGFFVLMQGLARLLAGWLQ